MSDRHGMWMSIVFHILVIGQFSGITSTAPPVNATHVEVPSSIKPASRPEKYVKPSSAAPPPSDKYAPLLLNKTILPFLQTCESSHTDELCLEYYAAVNALNASRSKDILPPLDLKNIQFAGHTNFCTNLIAVLPKPTANNATENILAKEDRCSVYCHYLDPKNHYNILVKDICQYIYAIYLAVNPTKTTTLNTGSTGISDAVYHNEIAKDSHVADKDASQLDTLSLTQKKSDPQKTADVQQDQIPKIETIETPSPTVKAANDSAVLKKSPKQISPKADPLPNEGQARAVSPSANADPIDRKEFEEETMTPAGDDNYVPFEHNEEAGGGNEDDEVIPEQHPGAVRLPSGQHPKKDRFVEEEESNFFFYFMFVFVLVVASYVLYHNRRFVLALILEGRRRGGSGSDSNGRRKHTAAYRKLDSNLEEAIASPKNGTTRSQPIIY